jgi:1-deoxy-D-xylulose-5-phosphate reductoisomerase
MRLPIALGLAWPDRVSGAAAGCDWSAAATWTFEPLDEDAFPAVALARRAGLAGGLAPAVLNAANEVAVAAFLAGELPFRGIAALNQAVLEAHLSERRGQIVSGLDDIVSADAWARARAQHGLAGMAQHGLEGMAQQGLEEMSG